MKLREGVAVVTGGAGALGEAIVSRFLREGVSVAVPYLPQEEGARLQKRKGVEGNKLFVSRVDLTVETEVQEFAAAVVREFGGVQFLVNSAGGYSGGSTIELASVKELERMLDINLRTAFLMSRSVLPLFRSRGFGRIVSIAAMPALAPSPTKGAYAISKRAVVTLTETIAEEVKGSGITANAIAPSTILTKANVDSMPGADTRGWVRPEEIANLIVFLCTEEAGSINGNVIKIYGGQ